uniref:Uncharacterized protein n=1 Tax=Rhizophora mucronata TaxID=61149 RepID=A0A2P2L663_RHIMU
MSFLKVTLITLELLWPHQMTQLVGLTLQS